MSTTGYVYLIVSGMCLCFSIFHLGMYLKEIDDAETPLPLLAHIFGWLVWPLAPFVGIYYLGKRYKKYLECKISKLPPARAL